MNNTTPIIGILMGSNSDWPIMKNAADILEQFGVAFEAKVVSAHRMPDDMFAYAETAQSCGIRAIIAGAGGAVEVGSIGSGDFQVRGAASLTVRSVGSGDIEHRDVRGTVNVPRRR